jgi:hypothetical protein
LSRTGNRQLNAALHRIAMTQAPWHPEARAMIARRKAAGDGGIKSPAHPQTPTSDVVYRAMITDARCHRTGHRSTEEQGTLPPPAAAVHG